MSDNTRTIVVGKDDRLLKIETPDGLILISVLMGTSVIVYDDPEKNPVGMIDIRRKT